jgi:hypothetical protein
MQVVVVTVVWVAVTRVRFGLMVTSTRGLIAADAMVLHNTSSASSILTIMKREWFETRMEVKTIISRLIVPVMHSQIKIVKCTRISPGPVQGVFFNHYA